MKKKQGGKTREEEDRLFHEWNSHPHVVDFKENVEAMAWRENLQYDIDGVNRTLQFSIDWLNEHGPLPILDVGAW